MDPWETGVDNVWVNWNSRRTLGGISLTWPSPLNGGTLCGMEGPTVDTECSRELGPSGRHMAAALRGHIVSAWPGTHPPVKADLTEPEERA